MSRSERPVRGDRWAATQSAWARLLLDGFARAGVRDVVISPGSRSTPFVLAAHRHPDLRCSDILDERSAGFFALGQAKASGEPSLLICTSGTAGAHYLPAVMEASHSRTPLLVLTADRPFELQGCGANQTADQLRLYGTHVRRFFHLGRPDSSERALRALRRIAAQAVALAHAPEPGPVHLNAPARKPLEPAPESDAADSGEGEVERRAAELESQQPTRVVAPRVGPDTEAVREVARRLSESSRPLLVCGPAPLAQAEVADEIRWLAASCGIPLAVEATSQLRFGHDEVNGSSDPYFAYFEPVFRSAAGREHLRPDLIIQVGSAPASTGLLQLLAETAGDRDVLRVIAAPYGWPDPESSADLLVRSAPAGFAAAVSEAVEKRGSPRDAADRARRDWLESVRHVDEITAGAVERELAEAGEELTEGGVARELPRALPREGILALGNSLPVRQVDAWCPPGRGPQRVLSQRGLSGIDGLVSGAAGACSHSGRPTGLLVGDVSFLHDLNGLAAAREVEAPLAILVVNNGGGRLFEELPIAGRPDLAEALPHFTTPHGASLEHAAALFGHGFAAPTTVSGLRAALGSALSKAGCSVVEVRVPARGAVEQNGRVRQAVEDALGSPEAGRA